jgi:hypothetical protein
MVPSKNVGRQKVNARSTPASAKPDAKQGTPSKPRRRNRLSLVRSLIEKWAAELEKKNATKTGVVELVRLLALEKELTASKQEQVREIRVTWVEPTTTES